MSAASIQPLNADWKPAANPWIICVAVMLGTFMEVLDTSVANVALPHIAGSMSASRDEATWVLTSYLVSNAIVLPMTGWLGRAFGRKRFLLTCIFLFTISSLMCGAAQSLGMLIASRILQGVGGGALQPIAQAILLESFPVAKRGQAMAAYTLGIVFAPIIGPTIGGWITDNYSWRWVFYINIPVGIIATMMIQSFIFDPPHIKNAKAGRIDGWGFGLLVLWIGLFQIILDRGQQDDWFSARWIQFAAVIGAASLVGFVARELLAKNPLVDLRVLKNRNFATGIAIVTVIGVVLYGTTALLPLLLQDLMNYPALQSGMALSPRGIGSITAILIVGRIVNLIDTRILIGGGLCLLAYSSFVLGGITMDITTMSITWPVIINGAAVAMLFIPLSLTTTSTLKTEQIGSGTGLYNLMRNLGGSIGISMMTTMLARTQQSQQSTMVAHITPFDPITQQRLQTLTQGFATHMDPISAAQRALAVINDQVQQQSTMNAFLHNFQLMAVLTLACVPLVFFFKKTQASKAPIDAH